MPRAAVVASVALALCLPLLAPDQVSLATQCLIYGMVAVSLDLLMGYGGQISLGHAGLLAVGAYTTAIVVTRVTLPSPVALPIEFVAAGCVTAVVGLILGLPTGRLRGHYLAIATLGFGLAIPQLALNLGALTGGYSGILVPAATGFGITFDSPASQYYLSLTVLALVLAGTFGLLGTPTGRRFMAVRDSEAAASASGINVARTKVTAFTVSAFACGIAGVLFAHFNNLVAPSSFPFALSLFFFAAVLVGGQSSIWGALGGGMLLVFVQQRSSGLQGFAGASLGFVLLIVLIAAPGGLAGLVLNLRRLAARSAAAESAGAGANGWP